nr:centromere protein X-like [Nerophis lumbriciformis]
MAEGDTEITFKKETVGKLLSSFFKEDKTRLSVEATLLMAEMLKVFVQEAAVRSLKQAEREDCDEVDIEHFEKILPQLLSHETLESHERHERPNMAKRAQLNEQNSLNNIMCYTGELQRGAVGRAAGKNFLAAVPLP